MSRSYRVGILTLALTTVVACEDPFANRGLPDSPGVPVPGLTNFYPGSTSAAWSADSKTLYMATVGFPGAGSLIAIDPATLTVRAVGKADFPINLVSSPDAVYFATADLSARSGWSIDRMALADGSTTILAHTENPEFLVSPNDAALAYHAAGDGTTIVGETPIDTIVVLDIPTRTRRAISIGSPAELYAFSADGARLIMNPFTTPGSVQTWNVMTGTRQTIPVAESGEFVEGAAWSGANFHVIHSNRDFSLLTDTSLAGGAATTYRVSGNWSARQWLPDRSAIWMTSASNVCGPDDCDALRLTFVFTTAATATPLGSATSRFHFLTSASPDGQWLAHAESQTQLFLIHNVR